LSHAIPKNPVSQNINKHNTLNSLEKNENSILVHTNYDVAKSVGGGYQDGSNHDVIKTRPDILISSVLTQKTNSTGLRDGPTLDLRPGPTADINNQTYKQKFNDMLFADKKLDPKHRNSFLRSRAGVK
jgi:hypothetical protein